MGLCVGPIMIVKAVERRVEMTEAFGNRRGFTLTELLVVVAIIVLLTSIVIPNIAARLTVARMHAAENQILEMETALAAYDADFGTYPGDVFPTEDINNNGVLDTGEDTGVDANRDDSPDYGASNNRLDRGDGLVNIDDLEWALRTTAKNGPYMESIPLDPWDNKYVYYAPLVRPTNTGHSLYFGHSDPSNNLPPIVSEDTDEDGKLDDGAQTQALPARGCLACSSPGSSSALVPGPGVQWLPDRCRPGQSLCLVGVAATPSPSAASSANHLQPAPSA